MTTIRFKLDHDQLNILIDVMGIAQRDQVRGEVLSMVWSIIEQLDVRLRRRVAERRLEYQLILPVYQALALRRIAIAGQEFVMDERKVNELRLVLFKLDPLLTRYTT